MTSSVAAIRGGENQEDRDYTEDDWTNVDAVAAYPQSKTLAEQGKALGLLHDFQPGSAIDLHAGPFPWVSTGPGWSRYRW